jgi:hypothetical protein
MSSPSASWAKAGAASPTDAAARLEISNLLNRLLRAPGDTRRSPAVRDRPARPARGRRERHETNRCGLHRSFVAQTENRATAIPWARARATSRWQVSWLTGRRSMRTFPGPGPSGCFRRRKPAHLARRLQLQGQPRLRAHAPTPRSLLSPSRGTSAIMVRRRNKYATECVPGTGGTPAWQAGGCATSPWATGAHRATRRGGGRCPR